MLSTPKLEHRNEQHYVAILASLPQNQLASAASLFDEVLAWATSKDLTPSGPPFFRYLVIDMEHKLDVDVGFPVAHAVQGEGRVRGGVIPAGTYATAVHTGHFDELMQATADFLAWGEAHDVEWDTDQQHRHWRARLEVYLTDPAEEPDSTTWQTELAFKLADSAAREK